MSGSPFLENAIAPAFDARATTILMAGIELPVATLAKAIEHFHAFAVDFARYRLARDGTYEHMPQSGQSACSLTCSVQNASASAATAGVATRASELRTD